MMKGKPTAADLPLPDHWPPHVCRALQWIMAAAHLALVHTRSWCADSPLERVRLRGRLERAEAEIGALKEVDRIKSARLARIPPHKRPHYLPEERLHILEIRAARGWTVAQTARQFDVAEETIRIWQAKLDSGDTHLFENAATQPVNTYPDFVTLAVPRLKRLCPALGKVKLAQILARAGLHIAATTVGRKLKEHPKPPPLPKLKLAKRTDVRVVTATRPNHVWHVDLTEVPLTGLWVPWLPHALPQEWPFVRHVIAVIDHFSRACLGFAVFDAPPSSEQVTGFLNRLIAERGKPKHMISDKGPQFDCDNYKSWAKGIGIKLRFGKIGMHGSIAVIERFFHSLKDEWMRVIRMPCDLTEFREELALYVTWYNLYRPHTTLGGRTPVEVFEQQDPANEESRFEPRARYPRGSPCAAPQTLIKGEPGTRPVLEIGFLEGRKHLPIVSLKAA